VTGAKDEPLAIAWALLNHTKRILPIDEDRIYLSGVSSGGTACWEMIKRYPNQFAASVPMAFEAADDSRIDLLANVPIWAFHSSSDPGIPVASNRDFIASIKARGYPSVLTEIATDSHDCWTKAFDQYQVIDWMLIQKRGKAPTLPADPSQTKLTGLALPLLACGVIFLAVRSELIRRRNMAKINY
jgi:predicted peptidase